MARRDTGTELITTKTKFTSAHTGSRPISNDKLRGVVKRNTIREYATHLLYTVDFHDCYGRAFGLDYPTILAKVKDQFPESRTSMRALRRIVDDLDRNRHLPARRRSRRVLAIDYIRVQLLTPRSLIRIRRMVGDKFPDIPAETRSQAAIRQQGVWLQREGFEVPKR